jgi:hypothetical protein
MLDALNWHEVSIVYSNSHSSGTTIMFWCYFPTRCLCILTNLIVRFAAASSLRAFLQASQINVTGYFLVEKQYAESYKLVRNGLEQQRSSIVVVVAGPKNFVNFATQLRYALSCPFRKRTLFASDNKSLFAVTCHLSWSG